MEIKYKLVCPVCKSEDVVTYENAGYKPSTKMFRCRKCGQVFILKKWIELKEKLDYKTYLGDSQQRPILFPGHSVPICIICNRNTATIYYNSKFICVECYKVTKME